VSSLDGKQFSIFFPHGQGSFVQGFQRFVDGVKVTELVDRKSNPRLIIESQFLSSRIRLSRLYSSLLTTTSSTQLSPYDPLGFPKLSKDFLPTRIILVGSASVNPAMVSILSTIMNAPTYLLLATGLKRSFFEGEDVEEYQGREEGSKERKKTSASALGSAYKAAWIWEREMKGAKEVGSFGKYLKEKLEAQESGRGGIDSQEDQAQSQHVSTYQYLPEDSPLDEEKYPISSFSPPVVPFTNHRSHQRRSSSIYTLASSSSTTQTHSRHGSIYSSATSIFSSAPPATTSASSLNNGKNKSNGVITRGGVKQKMYNPEDDELFPSKPLEEDPAGLNLVAMPDEHEFKYYSSSESHFVHQFCSIDRADEC
jgi:xylulokinase